MLGLRLLVANFLTLLSGGTFSIIMKLEKSGDIASNITLAYESGQVSNSRVLAWVTTSSGAITSVIDRRVNSTLYGSTQYAPVYYSGKTTFTNSLAATTFTSSFYLPLGCKKFKGYIGSDATSRPLMFEVGTEGKNIMWGHNNNLGGADSYGYNTLMQTARSANRHYAVWVWSLRLRAIEHQN